MGIMAVDMNDNKAVLDVIREQYDYIFSAEKKVADFILENPEAAVNANVSKLANYSGVSDATVIRFCKHVGYQGYYQMKLCLSRDIGRQQVSDFDMEKADSNTPSGLLRAYAADLAAIGDRLDQEVLLKCAALITGAKEVHIVAVGNTSPLSSYMGFRLGRVGVRCTYSPLPEYFMNHVNLAETGDVVVAITQSGSSKQVVQAMELAKEKGLVNIAITAIKSSPVTQLADLVLLSGVGDDVPERYSRFREMAVIDALVHYSTNIDVIAAHSADKPEFIVSDFKL